MSLLTIIGLEGLDTLRMACQLVPKECTDRYQKISTVLSSILQEMVSAETSEVFNALLTLKLPNCCHHNGTPQSYRQELNEISQVIIHK